MTDEFTKKQLINTTIVLLITAVIGFISGDNKVQTNMITTFFASMIVVSVMRIYSTKSQQKS